MDINSVLEILATKTLQWRQVDGLPCVHTFYKDFYINLCSYRIHDKSAISINVDNVTKNENELVDQYFTDGSSEYSKLISVYNQALANCENIPSGSLSS